MKMGLRQKRTLTRILLSEEYEQDDDEFIRSNLKWLDSMCDLSCKGNKYWRHYYLRQYFRETPLVKSIDEENIQKKIIVIKS